MKKERCFVPLSLSEEGCFYWCFLTMRLFESNPEGKKSLRLKDTITWCWPMNASSSSEELFLLVIFGCIKL